MIKFKVSQVRYACSILQAMPNYTFKEQKIKLTIKSKDEKNKEKIINSISVKKGGKGSMVNGTKLNDKNKSKYSSNHNKYKKTKLTS